MNTEGISSYIRTEILNDPALEIELDQDLLLSGMLDSLGVTRLVAHLESETSASIPAQDVTLENFGSLRKIEAYLASRTP